MKTFLLVGSGGFLGSYLRYLISTHIERSILISFPFGTFAVNILGCFLIGLLYALSIRYNIATEYQKLLMAGFCGGFTTFSSFSFEGVSLLQDAQFMYGFLYAGLSLIIGFFAAWLGLALVRML
jgi:CrcB protein